MTHRVREVPGGRCWENWEGKVDSSNWSDGAGFAQKEARAFPEEGTAGAKAHAQGGTAPKKQKRSPLG